MSKWQSHTPLTSHYQLEIIKLIEEGIATIQIGWKLGPLNHTISQVVCAKEKFLKCDSDEHKKDKKANRLIADVRKGLVIGIERHIHHNSFQSSV